MSIGGENLMYTTLKRQDSELPIFYLPAGEDAPILLVFPSIYGIDTDLEELAFQINALDVSVVVVDLFWKVGKGPLSSLKPDKHWIAKRKYQGLMEYTMHYTAVSLFESRSSSSSFGNRIRWPLGILCNC